VTSVAAPTDIDDDVDPHAAALRSAYGRQIPVGVVIGVLAGTIAGAASGSPAPVVIAVEYGVVGVLIAAAAGGAGLLALLVAHAIAPRPAVRMAAVALSVGLVVAAGLRVALAALWSPLSEGVPWAGIAAAVVALACAAWAERRASRVGAPAARDISATTSAVWPVIGGLLGFVLGAFAVLLIREQLHISCAFLATGDEPGGWVCADGISYLLPALAFGALALTTTVAGALVAGLVRRAAVASGVLTAIAGLAVAALLALTWYGSAQSVHNAPEGVVSTDYWFAALGPAAVVAGLATAAAAVAATLPTVGRAGFVAGAGLLALATVVQPGLALVTMPAAGCLVAAGQRAAPSTVLRRRSAASADAVPTRARRHPVTEWVRSAEPVLWALAPIIGVVAWAWNIPRLLNVAGCEGDCIMGLVELGAGGLPIAATVSISLAVIFAAVLHITGRTRAWAAATAVVLVVASVAASSVAIDAGFAPMFARNEAIANGDPPPPGTGLSADPPSDPLRTPLPDPVGQWGAAVAGEPFIRFAAEGTFAMNDGCNAASGRWVTQPDGSMLLVDLVLPVSPCAAPDGWLLVARGATAYPRYVEFVDADGAAIGTLERSPG
jgi:hypothetical protein